MQGSLQARASPLRSPSVFAQQRLTLALDSAHPQMIRTLYQPFKELMMHSDFHWSETEQRFHATADAWAKQIEVRPISPLPPRLHTH